MSAEDRRIDVKHYTKVAYSYPAKAKILPGHIVELDSDGKLKPNTRSGTKLPFLMIALRDVIQGKGVEFPYPASATIDGRTVNVPVQCRVARSGDVFNLRVKIEAASGTTDSLTVGTLVSANNDGTVSKADSSHAPIGQMLEPMTDPGSDELIELHRVLIW